MENSISLGSDEPIRGQLWYLVLPWQASREHHEDNLDKLLCMISVRVVVFLHRTLLCYMNKAEMASNHEKQNLPSMALFIRYKAYGPTMLKSYMSWYICTHMKTRSMLSMHIIGYVPYEVYINMAYQYNNYLFFYSDYIQYWYFNARLITYPVHMILWFTSHIEWAIFWYAHCPMSLIAWICTSQLNPILTTNLSLFCRI